MLYASSTNIIIVRDIMMNWSYPSTSLLRVARLSLMSAVRTTSRKNAWPRATTCGADALSVNQSSSTGRTMRSGVLRRDARGQDRSQGPATRQACHVAHCSMPKRAVEDSTPRAMDIRLTIRTNCSLRCRRTCHQDDCSTLDLAETL